MTETLSLKSRLVKGRAWLSKLNLLGYHQLSCLNYCQFTYTPAFWCSHHVESVPWIGIIKDGLVVLPCQ